MKKIIIIIITIFIANIIDAQIIKDREFVDVPYVNRIETLEFTVLDINFDNNLLAFKHVFELETAYDEEGNIYEEACDCHYTEIENKPKAGMVLGVYDLSTQEYLKTFVIYNAVYEKSECYNKKMSKLKLDSAKQFFLEHHLDITKKPEALLFSNNEMEIDGVQFRYTNERTTTDDDLLGMTTVSNLIATAKQTKPIYTVYQEDVYYMASGGDTRYLSVYRKGDKIVFLSRFDFTSAMAGETSRQTYQFSPIFLLSDIKADTSYTFKNFISDCIHVKSDVFDSELDAEVEYPDVYDAEINNKDYVINYLAENYKAEYAESPAAVSVPLVFSTERYYAVFVEYQNEWMAICYDLFIIDRTGKLIDKELELTYHEFKSEMVISEFFKLTRKKDNTIDILVKRTYEGRTETVVLPPDNPNSHHYEIDETGNINKIE